MCDYLVQLVVHFTVIGSTSWGLIIGLGTRSITTVSLPQTFRIEGSGDETSTAVRRVCILWIHSSLFCVCVCTLTIGITLETLFGTSLITHLATKLVDKPCLVHPLITPLATYTLLDKQSSCYRCVMLGKCVASTGSRLCMIYSHGFFLLLATADTWLGTALTLLLNTSACFS